MEQSGLEYVVGAKLKTQARVIKEQILSPDHYQELNEDTSYLTIDLEGKRKLVVSYSKKRARKDQHDRQKEIDKLKKKLNRSRKPKEFISASGYKRLYRVWLQYQPLSPKVIRRELSHVQVSLLTHTQTGAVYAMPSSVSLHANKIYRVVGLKPTTTVYQVK